MTKIKKHIEIIKSDKLELSLMGRRTTDAMLQALRKKYTKVNVSIVNTVADLDKVISKKPDFVFISIKYVPGATPLSKVWVAEYLTLHGIEHVGSGRQAMVYDWYKPDAKRCVRLAGVRTARFVTFMLGDVVAQDVSLSFPLFVKPASMGGGAGIDENSIVYNTSQLRDKVTSLYETLKTDVLAEEYLPGREFSVAILKDIDTNKYIPMPIELVAPQNDQGVPVLSEEVKRMNEEVVLAVTDPALHKKICAIALAAFNALGARDYGRIDIRLDATGEPNFLEANLIPSLAEGYGSFPKACVLNLNMSQENMFLAIVSLANDRTLDIQSTLGIPILADAFVNPAALNI